MEIKDRVFTEHGPGQIISIAGVLYDVKLNIKSRWLKSDINTFHKNEILSIDEYEKTLPQKKITEIQLNLFETK